MKKILTLLIPIICLILSTSAVRADAITADALNYIKTQQDSSGRITNGFSAPSQWAAIAFIANNTDVSTIKNPSTSLKDFLLSDVPAQDAPATEWENRILAIAAIGENPASFGGVNYVEKLQAHHTSSQIGDTCSVNDDVFGLLALVASGTSAGSQIKQDALSFIISKQDPTDGGFGFSAPGCAWYSTSADMTGAALQALKYSKDNGLTSSGLDDAITKAKNYLDMNQNADGGFGYSGSSDTDTTGWVLMAFNVLGMGDTQQATNARNYLISQQSPTDGGIMAFDWGTSTYVSNSTTTAQATIALLKKGWILKTYSPQPSPSSSVSTSSTSSPSPSPSPSPTPKASPSPSPQVLSSRRLASPSPSPEVSPSPSPEILGDSDVATQIKEIKKSNVKTYIAGVLLSFALMFAILHALRTFGKKTVK